MLTFVSRSNTGRVLYATRTLGNVKGMVVRTRTYNAGGGCLPVILLRLLLVLRAIGVIYWASRDILGILGLGTLWERD